MPDLIVVDELFAHLVAAGVAQPPDAPKSMTKPSLWTNPRDGAPLPRRNDATWLETATVTIGAAIATPDPHAAWIVETFVPIIVRARTDAQAQLIHRQIRGLVVDPNSPGGLRRMWQMGDLLLEHSTFWRTEQQTAVGDGVYTREAAYRFAARGKALAGQPYAD